jgi:hypothetical protein
MTIAKQLKIKEFPFEIKDSEGKQIYYEDSDGTIVDNRPKQKSKKLLIFSRKKDCW